MKTYSVKPSEIKREWHLIDATDQILGKLATQAANLLMGKHKPMFSRHIDTGDNVVIINAEKIKVTGKKLEQKIYYRHTGYPGGLKQETMGNLLQKHPERVVEHAVRGMIPHNKLGDQIIKKLRVYVGPEHPHKSQTDAPAETGQKE
ncbi:MAG: 50S ribosomal protein L13 [Dehalococcoidales bacterium]|nr:50S ribosomal protein L13 [Dehalococcoidales bacterium]